MKLPKYNAAGEYVPAVGDVVYADRRRQMLKILRIDAIEVTVFVINENRTTSGTLGKANTPVGYSYYILKERFNEYKRQRASKNAAE